MATKSQFLSFREEMRGHLSSVTAIGGTLSDNPNSNEIITLCKKGYKNAGRFSFLFNTSVLMEDLDALLASPAETTANLAGYVKSARFGGKRSFKNSHWILFKNTEAPDKFLMEYLLFLKDENEEDCTFVGFKEIKNDYMLDFWKDTTTLYALIYKGKVTEAERKTLQPDSAGILRLNIMDFGRQATTFDSKMGPRQTLWNTARLALKFTQVLFKVYLLPGKRPYYKRPYPLYTSIGVLKSHPEAGGYTYPFTTDDGLTLNVTRFTTKKCQNVVVTIHGLTTSTDMFIMPEHENLVSYLLKNGFTDVWCVDARISNRYPNNLTRHNYTLDDVALYDIPAALSKVREKAGPDTKIHVICHCLGSQSFMMSLFGKQVAGIRSVISNSVSLHVHVPWWSRIKLAVAPFIMEYVLNIAYLNPNWRKESGFTLGKAISWSMDLIHKECSSSACHMLSLMWGTGFPALFKHENMHPVTHRRLGDLFGGTSMNYHRHVNIMSKTGHAIKHSPSDKTYAALPDDYLTFAKEIKTPILFTSGDTNRIFTDSNKRTYNWLKSQGITQHEYREFKGYGHQDVFMGRNASTDTFPAMLEFLKKHAAPSDNPEKTA